MINVIKNKRIKFFSLKVKEKKFCVDCKHSSDENLIDCANCGSTRILTVRNKRRK